MYDLRNIINVISFYLVYFFISYWSLGIILLVVKVFIEFLNSSFWLVFSVCFYKNFECVNGIIKYVVLEFNIFIIVYGWI